MNYYIDTEFQEAFTKPVFGKRRHFIDLISIAIVSADGREYYAISKEFDLKKVWKDDWLRENVLKQIHKDLSSKESTYAKTYHGDLFLDFTYKSMRNLIKWRGKSSKFIAQSIKEFVCSYALASEYADDGSLDSGYEGYLKNNPPEFYGYYSDYDWVVFCSLFGRMIDLPKGFPMYCRDLKQMRDEISAQVNDDFDASEDSDFPIQTEGEHSSIEDAKWNKQLHEFLIDFKNRVTTKTEN